MSIEHIANNAQPKFSCPKCGAPISIALWGAGWDWDYMVEPCSQCGYEGELNTMTGFDPDGSVWQDRKENYEEESSGSSGTENR